MTSRKTPSATAVSAATWTTEGFLQSEIYDDLYCSKEGGDAETMHVFLQGNHLLSRWDTCIETPHHSPFTIAELGFGTGLNFLVTLQAWQRSLAFQAEQQLVFHSFEKYPLALQDIEKHLAAFQGIAPLMTAFLERYAHALSEDFEKPLLFPSLNTALHVHTGEAYDALKKQDFYADAWFLDGFAPAKNPDLWHEDLMQAVAAHTIKGGTFATYTAARMVREHLTAAGFTVEKIKGFGKKRDMLRGVYASPLPLS